MGDINERQAWLDYLGRPDQRADCPVKILYYGHSFVSHFQDYVATLPAYMSNFGMSNQEGVVYYKSLSGAPISRLAKRSKLNIVNKIQPEIVILEAGTNDLAEPDTYPGEVCDNLIDLIRGILDCRVREVIVSQVLLRGDEGLAKAAPDFTDKVYLFNHMVESALQYLPRAFYWHHRNLWREINDHVEDGTHLNDLGHKKLYRSLKGALNTAVARVRPLWIARGHY